MKPKVMIGISTYNRANRYLVPVPECAMAQDCGDLRGTVVAEP